MSGFYDYLGELWSNAIGASWNWFNALNREEWIIVLVAFCAAGFLCMRGYGSRSNF